VPVHVNQPWHQRATAAVYEHGVGSAVDRQRCGGDFLNLAPAHKNVRRRGEGNAFPVEDSNILEQGDWSGRGILRRQR